MIFRLSLLSISRTNSAQVLGVKLSGSILLFCVAGVAILFGAGLTLAEGAFRRAGFGVFACQSGFEVLFWVVGFM